MATPIKTRCKWATKESIMIDYHDKEWGVPLYNSQQLFEFLILEGCQAGLSWLTILKRRENYRQAFEHFNPQKIAKFSDSKLEKLLQNEAIIRNRLKIEAARTNARLYLEIEKKEGFSDFLWQFVNNKPIQNKWIEHSQVPAKTEISDMMSKELKKRGFKFVGSTICYAFMQAVGMVNDHTVDCYRYKQVKR